MVEFHILKKKYNHIGKVNEYNNSGHLHFYLKNINLKLLKNKTEEFIEYIYLCCLECLNISKKYKHKTYIVHVYLEKFSMKNFSLPLFRKLNARLETSLEDVLNICYIYNTNEFSVKLYKMFSLFINPITRKKILLV